MSKKKWFDCGLMVYEHRRNDAKSDFEILSTYLLVLCSIELDLTELILRVKCRHDIIALGFSTRRVVHNRGRILPRACLMPYIHNAPRCYMLWKW